MTTSSRIVIVQYKNLSRHSLGERAIITEACTSCRTDPEDACSCGLSIIDSPENDRVLEFIDEHGLFAKPTSEEKFWDMALKKAPDHVLEKIWEIWEAHGSPRFEHLSEVWREMIHWFVDAVAEKQKSARETGSEHRWFYSEPRTNLAFSAGT